MPNNGGKERNDGSSGSSGGLLKKGPWTAAEDAILIQYVRKHGEGNWNVVQKNSGLSRCGKSCRLRWANHLRPNLKKGSFSPEEERLILELHSKLGNKWARMAAQLPGRTDNEIKNYWNTRIKRQQRSGLPPFLLDTQKEANPLHLHQSCHSSFLIPPTQLSSSHSKPIPNYRSPLSLLDSTSISSTAPLLIHYNDTHFPPTPVHEFKCIRGNNVGFSVPCPTPHSPSPSALFGQSHFTQWPPVQMHQYNCSGYGLNPSPILQHNHIKNSLEPDGGLVPPLGSTFSMKLELPSSQLPQPAVHAAALGTTSDYKIVTPLTCNNSKPLDTLLQDQQIHAIAGTEDLKIEEKCRLDGFFGNNALPYGSFFNGSFASITLEAANQWDDLSSASCSIGVKRKKEPKDEIDYMDEELSSLLEIIPSTMLIPECGYGDCGEFSNGQSSGVTEDDVGLEMQQQLASSLTPDVSTTDHDWALGIWNNMPGIC